MKSDAMTSEGGQAAPLTGATLGAMRARAAEDENGATRDYSVGQARVRLLQSAFTRVQLLDELERTREALETVLPYAKALLRLRRATGSDSVAEISVALDIARRVLPPDEGR